MNCLRVPLLFGLAVAAAFVAQAETADAILARMDKAAPSFTGVSANLKMQKYTKILDDKTDESGTLQMQRVKGETKAVVDFSAEQDSRILSFENKTVRIYYPKLNEFNEVDTRKEGNVLNQFLLLGFGSSGKDLSAAYDITNGGTVTLGQDSTTKLLLVPKSPQMKDKIEKVEIWILEGATYPVQQQFFQPSGNYDLVRYSNVVLNPAGQKVALKMPSSARKQKK